jgi:hypothetical protein
MMTKVTRREFGGTVAMPAKPYCRSSNNRDRTRGSNVQSQQSIYAMSPKNQEWLQHIKYSRYALCVR